MDYLQKTDGRNWFMYTKTQNFAASRTKTCFEQLTKTFFTNKHKKNDQTHFNMRNKIEFIVVCHPFFIAVQIEKSNFWSSNIIFCLLNTCFCHLNNKTWAWMCILVLFFVASSFIFLFLVLFYQQTI